MDGLAAAALVNEVVTARWRLEEAKRRWKVLDTEMDMLRLEVGNYEEEAKKAERQLDEYIAERVRQGQVSGSERRAR